MEDTEIRFHSGIPAGHKFFAFLLAAAVAGAGCAWLIHKSTRSAAELAFNPTLAQQLDAGIASAQHPAVALADFMLNDAAVAKLAQQAHLASSTPAGQIGEFRSDLQLTQASPQQLDVRFQAADASQSIAVANAVAQALTARNAASAAIAPPPAHAQSATPAPAPAAQPAPAAPPVEQGQAHPAAETAPPQSTPPTPTRTEQPEQQPAPPLSAALRKIGAQLSATNQQLDRLAAGGAANSYAESGQQSVLRNEVHQAQRTLAGLRRQYAKELADPSISARVDEIHQALDSILPGGYAAAGVSRSVLRSERSELRQAAWIVGRETDGVQLEEAAHPASTPQPTQSATSPTPDSAPATPPPAATAPAPSSSTSSAPTPSPASPPAIAEQNLSSTPIQAPQSTQNPWSIIHLAAPAVRLPLWPAIVAGIVCGLLYLGIAAFAYRRGASDDIYPDLRSAPQRMITPDESAAIEEPSVEEPEPPPVKTAPRHRAAFVFQPAPPEDAAPAVERPAPAEKSLPLC